MTARRVLLIDSQGARALRRQRRSVQLEADFPAARTDVAAMDTYLRGVGKADFTLVLNVADESCVPDLLPPARRRDRQALAARRLANRFPDHSLRLTQHFDDGTLPRANLLLYAQPEGPLVAAWRAAISRNGCRLAAIWPLASLLAANSRAPTLVACQTRAGLRITLALRGQFAFTRLAVDLAVAPPGTPDMARVAQELTRTRSYLAAQGLVADGIPTVDAGAGQPDPDIHIAALLPPRHRRPPQQLAPPAWRQAWRRHRWAHRLNLATLAAIGLGIAILARMAWQLADLGVREQAAANVLVGLQAQRHQLTRAVADPADIAEAAALVRLDRALAQGPRLLGDSLAKLSQGLERTPSLDLRHLSWNQDAPGSPVRLVARLVCASHAASTCDPGHFGRNFFPAPTAPSTGLTTAMAHGQSEDGRRQLAITMTAAGTEP